MDGMGKPILIDRTHEELLAAFLAGFTAEGFNDEDASICAEVAIKALANDNIKVKRSGHPTYRMGSGGAV